MRALARLPRSWHEQLRRPGRAQSFVQVNGHRPRSTKATSEHPFALLGEAPCVNGRAKCLKRPRPLTGISSCPTSTVAYSTSTEQLAANSPQASTIMDEFTKEFGSVPTPTIDELMGDLESVDPKSHPVDAGPVSTTLVRKITRRYDDRKAQRARQTAFFKLCEAQIDDTVRLYHPLFLRDSCTCASCVDPSSRQKNFSTVDIPADITVKSQERDEHGITFHWSKDVPGFDPNHVTFLSHDFLRRAGTIKAYPTPERLGAIAWDNELISKVEFTVDYHAYMDKDSWLHGVLTKIRRYGLVFLKNVPESEESVVKIVNRIGPLKNTFYGSTWDVRSVPNAKNVAYTNTHLGFHMDLLYMHQPPRLQFLHCLRASTSGGASLFSDSYLALQKLYDTEKALFETLCNVPTTFHYDHEKHHYHYTRPTIELRPRSPNTPIKSILHYVEAVNWSPPFQGPLNIQNYNRLIRDTHAYHAAASAFRDLIEQPSAVHERQLAPGECVIFDNRRVLHARTAFKVDDIGKERWLKGAYLDWDPYASKLRVSEKQFGPKPIENEDEMNAAGA